MKTYALRLRQGQDLRAEIDKFTEAKNVKAGVIILALRVSKDSLRMANAKIVKTFEGSFEIVALEN